MPAFLVAILWQVVLPDFLKSLVNEGIVSAEKATGITSVQQLVSHLKTYQEYPTGRNGQ